MDCSFSKLQRCVHTNWITRVSALWNFFAHTVAVTCIILHLLKKNNPLRIFTFLKHFLHCFLIHFNHYKCPIVHVSSNWLNSLLNSLVTVTSGSVHVERKKRTRWLNILIMKIYHINFSNISKTSKCWSKCT